MAKILKGILGPFSGTVGPVVGSSWKDVVYMKAVSKKVGKRGNRSAAQVANQEKFRFVSEWLVPFHAYVSIGFLHLSKVKSEINLAFSEVFHHAVVGVYPDFSVDYSKVVLSRGVLGGLVGSEMVLVAPDRLRVSWSDNPGRLAAWDDQVMLVVYCPELGITDGFVGGAKRADRACEFRFNEKMVGRVLQVYISVTSFNRKRIADSFYLGEIG